jgi:hypothetical protein
MKTLEELITQNEKDKRALDLIMLYLNYIGNYNDIQNRLIEAGEPVDSKVFRLMDEQKDAFRNLWLSVAEEVKINDLSTDVWFRFFKLRHDVKFNS